jgi:hypothetical protein
MRLAMLLFTLAVAVPAASAGPVPAEALAPAATLPRAANPISLPQADNCPRTASHYAGQGSMYRGDPVAPQKLTELPPAVGFMAVYRTVNGCEVPMTIIEYRTGRRR